MIGAEESFERVELNGTDPVFAEWVEELAERLQAGEPVDSEECARAHPEWAERIRRLMPAIAVMADLGRSAAAESDGGPIPSEGLSSGLRVLGDFQLVREIGRGGMGIVYEAQQLSLHRRVALKVLPLAAAMDGKQLQRFRLEAQAAACLHHTHVVPVHAVGCERGVNYYAMQFIEGHSLAELIKELRRLEGLDPADQPAANIAAISISTRAAALISGRLASQTGRTGDQGSATAAGDHHPGSDQSGTEFSSSIDEPAARTPGPSSVPSSSSSTRNRDYIRTVAKFGVQVAEALDHAHALGILHRDIKPGNLLLDDRGQLWVADFGLAQIQGNPCLTLTGDILGTLRYMSPEQALGKRVVIDGRTDIYSLGVTLYELLTLRPAIDGHDRAEILRKIAEAEPPPPRKLNPAVPRDLETIVLKAMAEEPGGRYATAKELADDLKRFLEDRPITARRPSLLDRAAKWTRRHRPLVVSAAVATVLFLILAVVVLAASNLRTQKEQHRADEEKERAEANLRKAREVVDRMFTRVAQDLAHAPRMEKVRRALLVDALEFYREFLKENSTSPTLRYETARAYIKVGDIHHILGQYDHAEGPWRQAIALLEKLSRQFPAIADYREGLAYCFGELGLGLGRRSWLEEGIKERLHELDLREKLAADFPTVADYRRKLAIAHTDMGNAFWNAERVPEAEHHYRRALLHWDKLRADFPEVPEDRKGLAYIHHWWGNVLFKTNRLPEAEAEFRKVLAIRERLVADDPGNDELKSLLAHIQDYLGKVLLRRKKLAEAEDQFRRSIHLYEALIGDFPDTQEFRLRLAIVYDHLGSALSLMGRVQEAIVACRRAISEEEKVTSDSSQGGVALHGIGGGWGYYHLGQQLQATGRVQEAADAFRHAKDQFEKKAADNPRVPSDLRELAQFFTTCPAAQFRDVPRAITLAKQALQFAPLWRESWYTLGVAEYQAGHWDAAIEALGKWTKLGPSAASEVGFMLAIAHRRVGHREEARKWYDNAVGSMDQKGPPDEELLRLRAEAAKLLQAKDPARSETKNGPR